MDLKRVGKVSALAILTALTLGTVLMAQQSSKVLTNADVIKMVRGGVPESVIITSIKSNSSNFDLSPDALIHLHRVGVPKRVLDAMMSAGAQPPTSSAPSPAEAPPAVNAPPQPSPAGPAPMAPSAPGAFAAAPMATPSTPPSPSSSGLPSVEVLLNGVAQPIAIERTQLEETRAKPSSMMSLASDSALTPVVEGEVGIAAGELAGHVHSGLGAGSLGEAGGLMSGIMAHRKPSQTYVWAVPNPSSPNAVPTRSPVFAVTFSDIPGIRASDYEPAIVKLTPAQNAWRLVGATQGKDNATANSSVNWQIYESFLEDRVPLRPQKTGPGEYRIAPVAPLLPGEYAVVLRPISKSKKFSGADVARAQGDGLMFDAVWSFQIPMDAKP